MPTALHEFGVAAALDDLPLSMTRISSAAITVDSLCAMISVVRPTAMRSSSAWIAFRWQSPVLTSLRRKEMAGF